MQRLGTKYIYSYSGHWQKKMKNPNLGLFVFSLIIADNRVSPPEIHEKFSSHLVGGGHVLHPVGLPSMMLLLKLFLHCFLVE